MREVGERHPDEIASIEEMTEEVLYCKSKGRHDFRIVSLQEQTWGDETYQICNYCKRELEADYDPNGKVLYAHYKPLKGAKVAGERLYMNDYRRELLRRYKIGGMGMVKPKPLLRVIAKKSKTGTGT